mgnify:CR=1 FL=1
MRIVALAVILALLLAGCSGAPKTDSSSDATGGTSASGTATGSASGSAGSTGSAGSSGAGTTAASSSSVASSTNRAPIIILFKANLTGLVAVLEFNATDADKNPLTFVLSFGDATVNATGSLPKGNVTHTFAAAGNYTAKLAVSDGKASVNRTLVLKVTLPTGGASDSIVFTGDVEPTCGLLFDLAFDIPAELAGAAYTLTPDNIDVSWWIGEGLEDPIEAGGNSGTVPDGTTSAHVCWDEVDPVIGIQVGSSVVQATLTITP